MENMTSNSPQWLTYAIRINTEIQQYIVARWCPSGRIVTSFLDGTVLNVFQGCLPAEINRAPRGPALLARPLDLVDTMAVCLSLPSFYRNDTAYSVLRAIFHRAGALESSLNREETLT